MPYQIKLTPVESFFFGSEKHNAELTTNYFVESNLYPQQTALLGLIRYYLLLQNHKVFADNKIINTDEAAKIIGAKSFNYPDAPAFGKIKTITPLYFINENKKYFFAPLDIHFQLNEHFHLHKNGKPFNAKDQGTDIQQYLYSVSEKKSIALSSIIKDAPQTGNEKGEKGESKENAFYKQVMKKFKEKTWCFAFDAEIEEESNIEGKPIFIPFGGEKCLFKMEISKTDKLTKPAYPSSHIRNVYALLCASDCFVDWKEISHCDFAVNNYTSFRNFQSTTSTKKINSYNRNNDIEDGQVRSSRYNLLQRGSVLYFKNEASCFAVRTAIESSAYTVVGFNQILLNK